MNILLASLSLALGVAEVGGPSFVAAKPVWLEGRETEKNLNVAFRSVIEAPEANSVILRTTGSTIYRAFVNGAFAGHGPARAARDYFRVDEWDITPLLKPGANVIAIEVAGYNANSYYVCDQPSFLQAELVADGAVLAATGEGEGFLAAPIAERVQKVQRYSFQRPFMEAWDVTPEHGAWRKDPAAAFDGVAPAVVADKNLLVRRVPYPNFFCRPAEFVVARGGVTPNAHPENEYHNRSIDGVGPKLGGYPREELTLIAGDELAKLGQTPPETVNQPCGQEPIRLEKDSYVILDLGTNLTGFPGVGIDAGGAGVLHITFDEILMEGDVSWGRMGCVNTVRLGLQSAGSYDFEAIEPYTMRYVKLIAMGAPLVINGFYLREYANPDAYEAQFACSDQRLNRIFDAGRETFVQNAVDIFMDCPSRERAGWLCDSFFTARSAMRLSGDTRVEKNFIENYALPQTFPDLPAGMLPMCYPSDHYDGVFIPNWSLWFVMELQEYAARSGDRELVAQLKPRIAALFDYFAAFENEDGLLEKLESWVFVEWSEANKFVQDVNYPSNMLYAAALAAAGQLYEMPDWQQKAEAIRETIRKQSFDGEFFVDNAVRKDGKLEVTRNRTEVCQYFAFFFNVATPESHPDLWRALVEEFGPDRKERGAYPEVHPANSFVGNMLRFEILSEKGLGGQILEESIGYLLYMADATGTLWENTTAGASCNHGFASHIVHTLYRDALGVYNVDWVDKEIHVRLTPVDLEWCEGTIPTPDGFVGMRWRREEGKLVYTLNYPAGYTVGVDNQTGLEAVRTP